MSLASGRPGQMGHAGRVADIRKAYQAWAARGSEFLTGPKDHGYEIRAYLRDQDGHLIEVGQTTPR
jgi:lactoylglutathione lyase